ncbi:G-type lectin S-receptor serine/threonine-protein kinase [Spatholobus suberectus]|nr:G-type lectin S-receptor serine/threonine-protein kinase [Spatholobus suberectus]
MVDSISIIELFCLFLLLSFTKTCTSLDSLAVSQSIRDGESLVSADGTFEVGFFSPGNSTGRYLGVWYRNLSPLTVVWVANRGIPLKKNLGVLKLNEKGVLVILNDTKSTVWSSNTSNKAVNDPIALILDSGNLVIKNGQDAKEENLLWQSFDHPCDTMMPGMKLGWNLVTGLDRYLSSWKSEDDPAKGEYSFKVDIRGYPQLVLMKGSIRKFRLGSWNGLALTGYPTQQLKGKQGYKFVMNAEEVYHQYENLDSLIVIYTLNPSGILQGLAWTSQTNGRKVISAGAEDSCDNYAFCGANSMCNMYGNVPKCECLKGYVPKFPEQWNIAYWSGGCVPMNKDICKNNTDHFLRYTNMKLPDTSLSWFSKTMNLEECQRSCLKNCSCSAYANLDIRDGGSGCLLWFEDLVDMRRFSQWGQDLYIRVPASELDTGHGNKKKKIIGITIGVIIFALIAFVSRIILRKQVAARVSRQLLPLQWRQEYFRLRKEDMDLPTFDLPTIAKATDNFSSRNKLGEGGFGPVYKGTLVDGLEVAIKRHSKMSNQGLEEFKNEVLLIAKLQHRNLVKLLGCCIRGEEKMLIYEYMPNRSLDLFIFDETRSKLLTWRQHFNIIDGIARGLLYLHQDSRLRIVHRDLKTSNILLDAHMNPKISDFGLARTFGGDQIEDKTKKVVGTYGYMPPEYVVHGHYSAKSDVFSFGVIVLEIVSGKKNRKFSDPEHSLNLLGHAWRLWTEDRPLELIGKHLHERCNFSEVLRCIHVGLLCVQQKQGDRPDMSSVILMLNGEKLLPQPKAPGFYTGSGLPESVSASRMCNLLSTNEMSLTIFEAR